MPHPICYRWSAADPAPSGDSLPFNPLLLPPLTLRLMVVSLPLRALGSDQLSAFALVIFIPRYQI